MAASGGSSCAAACATPADEILRIERGEEPSAADAGDDGEIEAPAPRPAARTRPSVRTAPAAPVGPLARELRSRVRACRPSSRNRGTPLCVAHRKGGVAKSTTTWFLARELARAGKRVLLRDLDPQQGLRDILRDHGCEDGRYSKTIALVSDGEPLPFIPDVELIDTPPALDDSLPGVARADVVIVPAMPEHQAVRALERMLLVLQQTRHEHPFTRVLGLLPVRVKPRWSEHAAFMQQIEMLGQRFGHPGPAVDPGEPRGADLLAARAALAPGCARRCWPTWSGTASAGRARSTGRADARGS